MFTADLHYHANVYGKSDTVRRRRAADLRAEFAARRIDVVASTEHAYKGPVEAYEFLRDTLGDEGPAIIPGVEVLTKEGVDLIVLFRDLDAMRAHPRLLAPGAATVEEAAAMAGEEMVKIIPHPYTLGRTGIVRQIGEAAFQDVQTEFDYVEICNGAHRNAIRRGLERAMPPGPRRDAEQAASLDPDLVKPGVGRAVGSDSHFPNARSLYGVAEAPGGLGPFDALRQRLAFTPRDAAKKVGYGHMARELIETGREAWLKTQL